MILFQTTEQLEGFFRDRPNLASLELVDSPIERLPELPKSLKLIRIVGCPRLTQIPALPQGLTDLLVYQCPAVTSIPVLPSSLELFSLHDCPGITALPLLNEGLRLVDIEAVGIQAMPAVPRTVLDLRVAGCPVPEELPVELQYLEIDSRRVDLLRLFGFGDGPRVRPEPPSSL